jgi:hypothetical protein
MIPDVSNTRNGGVKGGHPFGSNRVRKCSSQLDGLFLMFDINSDGVPHVDTSFSCLLGKPPIMVEGLFCKCHPSPPHIMSSMQADIIMPLPYVP